jgi:hypothetical protein
MPHGHCTLPADDADRILDGCNRATAIDYATFFDLFLSESP